MRPKDMFFVTFGRFSGCVWLTFGTLLEDVGAIWAVVGCPGLLWAILGVGGCWVTFHPVQRLHTDRNISDFTEGDLCG